MASEVAVVAAHVFLWCPSRRALLLACCSSAHTAAWVLAVPTIQQQLQQQCFQLGAPFEAHGALWQLLTDSSSGSSIQQGPAGRHAAGPHAQQQQQLLSLLALPSGGGAQQLQRQVVVLQLMVDVTQAAGSRRPLWGEPVGHCCILWDNAPAVAVVDGQLRIINCCLCVAALVWQQGMPCCGICWVGMLQ